MQLKYNKFDLTVFFKVENKRKFTQTTATKWAVGNYTLELLTTRYNYYGINNILIVNADFSQHLVLQWLTKTNRMCAVT